MSDGKITDANRLGQVYNPPISSPVNDLSIDEKRSAIGNIREKLLDFDKSTLDAKYKIEIHNSLQLLDAVDLAINTVSGDFSDLADVIRSEADRFTGKVLVPSLFVPAFEVITLYPSELLLDGNKDKISDLVESVLQDLRVLQQHNTYRGVAIPSYAVDSSRLEMAIDSLADAVKDLAEDPIDWNFAGQEIASAGREITHIIIRL